jgi:hypothetical protein
LSGQELPAPPLVGWRSHVRRVLGNDSRGILQVLPRELASDRLAVEHGTWREYITVAVRCTQLDRAALQAERLTACVDYDNPVRQ